MKLKKILIFCILIFSIIFISEASAEIKDVLEADGTDWTTGPDLWRLAYVSGFIAGAGVVRNKFYFFGDWLKNKVEDHIEDVPKVETPFEVYQKAGKEFEKEAYNKSLNEISLIEITAGQIMDGVNDFYNDFSNRRIKIVDAIYVVKMQIKGEDPELIDSQIRYLKMQPIDLEIKKKCSEKYWAFREKKGSNLTYKEIKNGDFSFEDLLRAGMFIDANNILHDLFCYGVYK